MTTFYIYSIIVDNAALSPSPFAVDVNIFVRKNRAVFDNSKAQFSIGKVILAEEIFRRIFFVKIVKIVVVCHQETP